MSVINLNPATFPESPFRANILAGRRAVISGGGSGIGFEIARQLGLHGAAVCIMGRRENVLQAAVDRLRADGVRHATLCRGDVRDFDSCAAVAAHAVAVFGGVDTLVNCAAGNFLSPAEALTAKGFRVVMEIDSFGVFNMSQAFFPHLKEAGMAEKGDAAIINITAEFNRPPFFQLHAAAAKMAINSMTKSHSLEWADYGIRVNGIAPGPIANTAGMGKLAGIGGGDPSAKSLYDPNLPRGLQLGLTWDIGQACVYYCSSAGGYISGDIMTVDGGHHLREGIRRKPDGHLAIDRELISNLSRQRERSQRKAPVGVGGATSKL